MARNELQLGQRQPVHQRLLERVPHRRHERSVPCKLQQGLQLTRYCLRCSDPSVGRRWPGSRPDRSEPDDSMDVSRVLELLE
jgi:hypothetical protein